MINNAYYHALRSICQPVRAADFPRSLEPMLALLAGLDNPQARFPSVVVAGSVGKGTTCWRIARALWDSPHPPSASLSWRGSGNPAAQVPRPEGERRFAGVKAETRVGLYTGPHLHSFRERFVINGGMISHAEFIEGAKTVTEAAARLNYHYSTFELATALALWWFAQQPVNIAVLEVGMGGRWDAVNAVPNVLAVITPIEKEHLAMLGGSLQTIAWHKAGIMQPGSQAVTFTQPDTVMDILRMESERLHIRFSDVYPDRAAIILDPVDAAAWSFTYQALAFATLNTDHPVRLPGRIERVEVNGKSCLIDGAHTVSSALKLRQAIRDFTSETDAVRVVIGMLGDKAVHNVLEVFDEPRFHIVLTQAPSHRALSPAALNAQAHLQHASVEIVPQLAAALAQVHTTTESLFVVTGSLRMAAAARETFGLLSPEELDEARQTRAIFEGEDYLRRLP
jgi:dihydrofolate synthase/folylpolyglutamate synthase